MAPSANGPASCATIDVVVDGEGKEASSAASVGLDRRAGNCNSDCRYVTEACPSDHIAHANARLRRPVVIRRRLASVAVQAGRRARCTRTHFISQLLSLGTLQWPAIAVAALSCHEEHSIVLHPGIPGKPQRHSVCHAREHPSPAVRATEYISV